MIEYRFGSELDLYKFDQYVKFPGNYACPAKVAPRHRDEDNLTAQLIAAEDTLSQKDKEIERQNKDLEAYNIRCVSRRCLKCA